MDPRVERTRTAVHRATLAVLAARGYAAFTVEAVAAAAGVAKSTVYRHWPSRLALIADSLDTLNVQPRPGPRAGGEASAREQVHQLLAHLADVFADSLLSSCVPALIEAAEHHPEVAEFLHTYSARRRARLEAVLREGVERGELDAGLDPELAALALSGPVIYCRTMAPEPLGRARAAALVDLVLGPGPAPGADAVATGWRREQHDARQARRPRRTAPRPEDTTERP